MIAPSRAFIVSTRGFFFFLPSTSVNFLTFCALSPSLAPGLRRRIQLIQDFDMPAASLQVAMSRDGGCIMATGVYKPRIRCYEVDNLAMKFERHLTCDPVAIQPLSGGYEKMVRRFDLALLIFALIHSHNPFRRLDL